MTMPEGSNGPINYRPSITNRMSPFQLGLHPKMPLQLTIYPFSSHFVLPSCVDLDKTAEQKPNPALVLSDNVASLLSRNHQSLLGRDELKCSLIGPLRLRFDFFKQWHGSYEELNMFLMTSYLRHYTSAIFKLCFNSVLFSITVGWTAEEWKRKRKTRLKN